MKKIMKSLALMFMGLAVASCSDDDLFEGRASVGDEIMFGASASVEDGDAKDSRTAYGDVNAEGNMIAVNWCLGDQVDIACPEAQVKQLATYRIPVVGGAEGDMITSVATSLERVTPDAGLQWGVGQHRFFAIYPSAEKSKGNFKLKTDKKGTPHSIAVGTMPASYKGHITKTETVDGATTTTLMPSMDYAFMATPVTTINNPQTAVAMEFNPIVTALEFDIVLNDILDAKDKPDANEFITMTSMTLESATLNIAGKFHYNLENGVLTDKTPTGIHAGTVQMDFDKEIVMKAGDHLKATFFIVPDKEVVPSKDLTLQLFYKNSTGNTIVKTASIGKELQARKKYFFRNMMMPQIKAVAASNWFSRLNKDIYFSQLSFPVAGHVASVHSAKNMYKEQVKDYKTLWNQGVRGFELRTAFGSDKDATDFGQSPFVVASSPLYQKGYERFGDVFTQLHKFLIADPNETLVLICTYQSFGGKDNTEAGYDHGYKPQDYLNGLTNYLQSYVESLPAKPNGQKVTLGDVFVKLGINSTVQDMRGKIGIIVRLCDYDYVKSTGVDPTTFTLAAGWEKYISYINDWGTAIDVFDKRFANYTFDGDNQGKKPYRQGAFAYGDKKDDNQQLLFPESANKFPVERLMWYGESTTPGGLSGSFTLNPGRTDGTIGKFPYYAGSTDYSDYSYTVNGGTAQPGGGNAVVQCWERVIPDLTNTKMTYEKNQVMDSGRKLTRKDKWVEEHWEGPLWIAGHYENQDYYLFIGWPESLSEKKAAITKVMTQAMATQGDNSSTLFINSLCGYFPDATGLPGSWDPQYAGGKLGFPLSQKTGGDYATCAAVLNKHFCDEVDRLQAVKKGPLGVVVFDYADAEPTAFPYLEYYTNYGKVKYPTAVEASDASKSVCRKIIENNFSFELAKKPAATRTQTSSSQSMEGDGNIIVFK